MKRGVVLAVLVGSLSAGVAGHGGMSAVTWNREIARIVYDRCASCHRPGGSSFSLITYLDAQPHANEIKAVVLSRRMPPWGAVKGFGQFRNDQSLMQEQIELIQRWVDGGIRRGNNPRLLPKVPDFGVAPEPLVPSGGIHVTGPYTFRESVVLEGLLPERVPAGRSMRIAAERPDGEIAPLVWLHEYDRRYAHPFLFRKPLPLPAGTIIRGVPPDTDIVLLRAGSSAGDSPGKLHTH